ncbi:uncharacterized protein ALTATR162_LOCUS5649 [Alternaria atra]|uniref:Uncharacterized protein n=1 Tax=Alternaria atra TaxID=119953 RepID=A0A8J2I8F0_9PLEO|nr:uncharacterized protein ALTATR162_LOCUS5649 [Alternaria atra]CAG5159666.1 unnamed protein product [Alternaria atra]
MSHTTPDNLLKLAADLNKLGRELCATGGKLAQAATTLEQEAANVALANAHRWGVDVQVAVRAGPHGQWVGQGNEVVINGAKK